MDFLIESISQVTWQNAVMWLIGGLLIFLAIKKDMEPALLLPIGFGDTRQYTAFKRGQ